MPAADRIAMARELLAGTGQGVARRVIPTTAPPAPAYYGREVGSGWRVGWDAGHNACRAAMMGDEPAVTVVDEQVRDMTDEDWARGIAKPGDEP
jgi:hypothetical protein